MLKHQDHPVSKVSRAMNSSPLMKINGIIESENPLGGMFKTWSLRSFVGKFDGATKHQLYVTVNYFSSTRRKHFNQASDGSTTSLDVIPDRGRI